ncbi:MAG TPA: cyclase family protein [Acidimicrobiia bacterium]|nr:cyclase family protein [Acidimicrobiia bacterium]
MCAPTLSQTHRHSHAIGDNQVRSPERRKFLKSGVAIGAGAAMAAMAAPLPAAAFPKRAKRVTDLTHRLVKTFPSFFGPQAVFDQVTTNFDPNGFFSKEWTLVEHIGTHMDSPGHFDEGNTLVDAIDPDHLIAPIVVVDITEKAMDDPNAMVEPDDLIAYERGHGRIPRRALVCMNSGWADKVDDGGEFRGGTGFPDLNFPGFSFDATDWLVRNRDPVGIAVDTMSLDPGNSTTFAVHSEFLATGRYGIESIANLDGIPPRGALGFIGVVPWEDGSGAPCRIMATW